MHAGFNQMGEVFFALCKAVDSPVSLGLWLRFKYSHKELCSASINPAHYLDADAFRQDYAVVSYLSKWTGLDTGIDTAEVATSSFKQSEVTCHETNKRFRVSRSSGFPADVASVIHTARRIIARVLGPLSLSKVLSDPRWSPGATFDISRRDARVDVKMSKLPISVTKHALRWLTPVLASDLHWCAAILGHVPDGPCSILGAFEVVDGNRIVTVPKNAKTDRMIAIEPTGNIFLQKSVGAFIRRRLRSHGVDLNDQSINQSFARIAHDYGLATLDLKSASDTISLELVYELLPLDWAFLLDDLRSKRGLLRDGTVIQFEKFSSMGNGFTFELESLIFYALCKAVGDHASSPVLPSVYGDDLIVPSECVPAVISVLNFCGFSLNMEKSYAEGQFRESCGRHYFSGRDVTPPYQKEVPDSLSAWIRAGNRLIRTLLHTPIWEAPWNACRRFGGGLRFTLPIGCEGDDAWVVPAQDLQPIEISPVYGIRCRVLVTRFHKKRVREPFSYAYKLRVMASSGSGDRLGYLTPTEGLPFDGTQQTDRVKSIRPGSRWVSPSS